MKQDGKFILMTREELKTYIDNLKGSKSFTSIQQHHTASPSYKDCKNGNEFALMKSMENYHVKNKGMSEIAQHFSTFPNGLICVGRPLTKDGGGFLYPLNKNSITIENVGNFSIDIMTEEQKRSIVFLNALLCLKFGIAPSTGTLIYHRWVKETDCPGKGYFGGNTKDSAEKYFIPLVNGSISNILGDDNNMYIKFGDKNSNVGIIQGYLKELGYYSLSIDSIYGTGTKTAVQKVQAKYGLEQNGNVSCNELVKLIEEYKGVAAKNKNGLNIINGKLNAIRQIVDG